MAKKEEFKHDPVRESIAKLVEFISCNKERCIQVAVTLVVIIIAAGWFSNSLRSKELEANQAFGKAQNLFIDGQTEIALLEFQNVVDHFSSTKSAEYARLYLLQEAFKNGDTELMSESIEKLESSKDPVIRHSAAGMKGHLALDAGNYDEAIRHYKSASGIHDIPSISDGFKLGILRAYLAAGKYQDVVTSADILLAKDDIKYNIKNEAEDLKAEAKFHLK